MIVNFSSAQWDDYYVGVPEKGTYKEIFNTDLKKFGGEGRRNRKLLKAKEGYIHGFDQYISVCVPPLTTLVFQQIKPNTTKI